MINGRGRSRKKIQVEFPFRFVDGGTDVLLDLQHAEDFSRSRAAVALQARGFRFYGINIYDNGIGLVGDGVAGPERIHDIPAHGGLRRLAVIPFNRFPPEQLQFVRELAGPFSDSINLSSSSLVQPFSMSCRMELNTPCATASETWSAFLMKE